MDNKFLLHYKIIYFNLEILGIYFIVKMFSADSYVFQFLSKKNVTRIEDSHVARIASCFTVIVNYGLYKQMEVYEPHWANYEELTNFHSSA